MHTHNLTIILTRYASQEYKSSEFSKMMEFLIAAMKWLVPKISVSSMQSAISAWDSIGYRVTF